jgi:hypothetical protein
MRRLSGGAQHPGMATLHTPLDAVSAVLRNPRLPAGDDERSVGFGVHGPPFASGHCLALRHCPATSFGPGYRSVWHRNPAGVWTFYATTPAQLSCARYFSSVTTNDTVQCGIDIAWVTPWSLFVGIDGLLEWHIEIAATPRTRLMSNVAQRLPARAWTNRLILGGLGRAAGAMLGAGQIRLSGTAPNGQRFIIAPTRLWAVAASRAVVCGEELGPVGPLHHQDRLADFRTPQRGLFAVGCGHFETYDATHHRAADRATPIG